ncbi:VOC family protein [Streptomyces sp. cmx-4-9]|uniref:VOC family protein n=1 Tax=Streptomyces sp. cmx-4-9 TaxID=2790941 RepID=UPI003980E5A3
MGIRLGSTVVNCADIEVMTRFWSEALGLVPSSLEPGDEFRLLRGEHVALSLQRAATPVTARDQMHLDLYTDEQEAQVARLVRLGARWVRHVTDDPADDYVVLADPEDNLFCVCAKPTSQVGGARQTG